jgi:hypothetical protein
MSKLYIKYDVAISLCKQDVDFAKKIVAQLNPGLDVFFYEDNQEELISKSGPEEFGKIFKESSRVVVILSRNEWSESFYTEIEKNAIIDRTSVKNQGYNFLIVIPIVPNEIPSWYPSTRIYLDPRRFSFEELAKFIEFKITEEGGTVKPITVEDRYQNLLERIEEKKRKVTLQETQEAIELAKTEHQLLKDCFNEKILFFRTLHFDTNYKFTFAGNSETAEFGIGDYRLRCTFDIPDELAQRIVTTQDFCVSFEIYKIDDEGDITLSSERRIFYYSEMSKGWALTLNDGYKSQSELSVLFRNRDNTKYYDLIRPLCSEELVDAWFQRLLKESSASIERYL